MKKIIVLAAALLCAAPYLTARHGVKIRPTGTTLNVENLTDDTFMVAVPGTNHGTSRNAVSLEPWERKSFIAKTAVRINGPLRFAVMDDMKKNHYTYYESSNRFFPIMFYQAAPSQMITIKKTGPGQYVLFPGGQKALKRKTTKAEGF